MGSGTRNPILGMYLESAKKWVKCKLNNTFLHFLLIFGSLVIFQNSITPMPSSIRSPLWKIIKYGKNWRKTSLVQLVFNPVLQNTSRYPKFGYLFCPLISIWGKIWNFFGTSKNLLLALCGCQGNHSLRFYCKGF